jgi:hypothetical protein
MVTHPIDTTADEGSPSSIGEAPVGVETVDKVTDEALGDLPATNESDDDLSDRPEDTEGSTL